MQEIFGSPTIEGPERAEDCSVKTEPTGGRRFPLDVRSMSALSSLLTGRESSTERKHVQMK